MSISIDVIPCGSTAYLWSADCRAQQRVTVLAVLVRSELVQYEVAWWCDGDRKTAGVASHELTSGHDARLSIGFSLDSEGRRVTTP